MRCRKLTPQLKVRRGTTQTAVLLKVLYNCSSVASLVHCGVNRADILEAAKTAKDDDNKRAANYRQVVHHSARDIPSETHTKGGMERLCRPRDNTGRHLRGDDVSPWNHGPTGRAQIDGFARDPSGGLSVSLCPNHCTVCNLLCCLWATSI